MSKLAALQARVGQPAPRLRLPASLQRYGVRVSSDRNTGNGNLVDVNITRPRSFAGSSSAPQA